MRGKFQAFLAVSLIQRHSTPVIKVAPLFQSTSDLLQHTSPDIWSCPRQINYDGHSPYYYTRAVLNNKTFRTKSGNAQGRQQRIPASPQANCSSCTLASKPRSFLHFASPSHFSFQTTLEIGFRTIAKIQMIQGIFSQPFEVFGVAIFGVASLFLR